MESFYKKLQLRWSDLDPNFHVRHSVYYDWGAMVRTEFLFAVGLTPSFMVKNHMGPVLFHEEAHFRRELKFGDEITMNAELVGSKRDYSRFVISHKIMRGEEFCAEVKVMGAWIDTQKRKLTVPNKEASEMLAKLPQGENFEWV